MKITRQYIYIYIAHLQIKFLQKGKGSENSCHLQDVKFPPLNEIQLQRFNLAEDCNAFRCGHLHREIHSYDY